MSYITTQKQVIAWLLMPRDRYGDTSHGNQGLGYNVDGCLSFYELAHELDIKNETR